MVCRRVATGGSGERSCGKNQWHNALALAWPGRIASVAPSQLDIPARSAVCPQSRPRHRSLPTAVERCSAGAARLRYSASTRRPASKQDDANIVHCRPPRGARSMLSTNTPEPARWPTSLRGTCSEPSYLVAASARTASPPSNASSFRSCAKQPYRSARRVFLIADNGSSHRGRPASDRLRAKWPNIVLVHTPVHASWLNQIEVYFSVVQRKLLTPSDFANCADLERGLLAFQARYQRAAKPFKWTFTRRDLHALLTKLMPRRASRHKPRSPNTSP